MANRYQILRKIGSGGMAEVFLAKLIGEGGFEKLVALKRMLPELTKAKEHTNLFLREARIAGMLNHPNIVQVFDGGLKGTELYLVLEFVDGADLELIVDELLARRERLSASVVAYIGSQICQALSFLINLRDESGKQLIRAHRDISPGNILVSRAGVVKLADFGVVRLAESNTTFGQVRGKWEYFPPEIVTGNHEIQGDLYALGVTLYQLFALHHPFQSDTPRGHFERAMKEEAARPAGIPDQFWWILATALSRNPKHRFRGPDEMADALDSYIFSAGELINNRILGARLSAFLPAPVAAETGEHPIPLTLEAPQGDEPVPQVREAPRPYIPPPETSPQAAQTEMVVSVAPPAAAPRGPTTADELAQFEGVFGKAPGKTPLPQPSLKPRPEPKPPVAPKVTAAPKPSVAPIPASSTRLFQALCQAKQERGESLPEMSERQFAEALSAQSEKIAKANPGCQVSFELGQKNGRTYIRSRLTKT